MKKVFSIIMLFLSFSILMTASVFEDFPDGNIENEQIEQTCFSVIEMNLVADLVTIDKGVEISPGDFYSFIAINRKDAKVISLNEQLTVLKLLSSNNLPTTLTLNPDTNTGTNYLNKEGRVLIFSTFDNTSISAIHNHIEVRIRGINQLVN